MARLTRLAPHSTEGQAVPCARHSVERREAASTSLLVRGAYGVPSRNGGSCERARRRKRVHGRAVTGRGAPAGAEAAHRPQAGGHERDAGGGEVPGLLPGRAAHEGPGPPPPGRDLLHAGVPAHLPAPPSCHAPVMSEVMAETLFHGSARGSLAPRAACRGMLCDAALLSAPGAPLRAALSRACVCAGRSRSGTTWRRPFGRWSRSMCASRPATSWSF